MYRFYSSCLAIALCSQAVLAQEHQAHEEGSRRHQGAHVHGEAILNFAAEGANVELYFEAPALDVVGFEHAPHEPKQIKAVEQALEKLRDLRSLVNLPQEAGCSSTEVNVESPLEEHHAVPADHGHQPVQEHAKGQDEFAHTHPPLVAELDTDQDIHTSFRATYRLSCQNLQTLRGIDVTAFKTFPSLERVQAQWVLGQQQGARQLNKASPQLSFN